jgi:F0F1-type ATP synthase gamma subunit
MATIIEIKKELNSINKIAKITNAMKVVAISRISRAKRRFLEIIELNNALCQTCALVLKELTTIDDHIKAKNPNTL